jgi:hypothetical protein
VEEGEYGENAAMTLARVRQAELAANRADVRFDGLFSGHSCFAMPASV